MERNAFIIYAVRTPRARRKGKFLGCHPVDLLTYPLNALKDRNGFDPAAIDDVLVGCVTQAGEQSWCIGRRSVLAAGWPDTVPATTINRLCGSGQQACNFAAAGIQSGTYRLVIGGGVEHMTRSPMFSDVGGEESPLLTKFHPDLVPQGLSAEMVATEFNFSRNDVDSYAYESQMRAAKAIAEGRFRHSVIGVPYVDEAGNSQVLDVDDTVRASTTIPGLGELKAVFKDDGVITAGNASAIVDGAAAVLIASEEAVKALSLTPRARIVASYVVGSPPKIMLTGPVAASRGVLERAGLTVNNIDVWEINEAFAPIPLMTVKELRLDPSKVNVNGGGISLGHPLGATGAMLIGTALDELERTKGKYALITMCIGLGMGIATIIERV